MNFTQEPKDLKCYYEMLENAQNEQDVDSAIEKIDSRLSFLKTEDQKKRIWEYLYNQYKLTPCFESLDNQYFYKLMVYKKQQIENKLQGKKQ